jgi:hypothetical protein
MLCMNAAAPTTKLSVVTFPKVTASCADLKNLEFLKAGHSWPAFLLK